MHFRLVLVARSADRVVRRAAAALGDRPAAQRDAAPGRRVVRRLFARLAGLVAFAGFAGTAWSDVLSGLQSNHNETLVLDSAR